MKIDSEKEQLIHLRQNIADANQKLFTFVEALHKIAGGASDAVGIAKKALQIQETPEQKIKRLEKENADLRSKLDDELDKKLKKMMKEVEDQKPRPPQKNGGFRFCDYCGKPYMSGERCHCRDYYYPPLKPFHPIPPVWCSTTQFVGPVTPTHK